MGAIDADAVYSRPLTLKVFISSVMRGQLMADRITAAEAIESTNLHHAWYWERDAHAGPYCSRGVCLGQARTSDALLLLIDDDISEVTLAEYEEAKRYNVARFVFLRNGAKRRRRADAFVKREQQSAVIHRSYTSDDELRSSIVSGLYRYAVDAHRRDYIQRVAVLPIRPVRLTRGA